MKTIDAFGKLSIDDQPQSRARLIQIDSTSYAAFPEADPKVPVLITATAPARLHGRNLVIETIGGGMVRFQRASCGCQTPGSLRGPASRLLALVPAPAEA